MEPNTLVDDSDGPDLFVVPVSGALAAKHLADSVINPISRINVADYFDQTFLDSSRETGSDFYYAWGAKPGKRNTPYWSEMKRDDYVIFYQEKHYTYVAQVLSTVENNQFASALWGSDGAGNAWQHVYFLTQPTPINVPIERISDYLQDAPHQNFVKLPDPKKIAILANYGSLEEFIAARFLNDAEIPVRYFLFRRNEESKYSDTDDHYNFVSTVANWTKIRPGSRVVFDQKTRAGTVVTGTAEIGHVLESGNKKPREFNASLMNFARFEKPIPLSSYAQTLIKSMPGYNAQHPIRPISQEVYEAIISHNALPNQYSPLPAPNEDLASTLCWSEDRTSLLIDLFNRSKQILFAGPPGTGKTFVATALAKAATDGHSHFKLVQFHPSYSYEDFVEGIRPRLLVDGPGERNSLSYELRRGSLRQFSESAAADPRRRYALVIDEINRANAARVFGELLYCLEYRGPGNTVELPYSGRSFFLPDNLWIIATMNSADRSIALLDAAFRRRFHQWTLNPDYEAMNVFFEKRNYSDYSRTATARLRRLNDELVPLVGEERAIGQSFFMKADDTELNFDQIWDEDLEPVVREHLYNRLEDVARLRSIFLAEPR